MNDIQKEVIDQFVETYGEAPALVVRAPGRVNLIGEHTDYNDGFVFPMAINRAVWIALRPREDSMVKLYSMNFDQTAEMDTTQLEKGEPSFAEYVKGVAWALQDAGYDLKGFEGVLKGDVPIGAALSSSAALELAVSRTFSAISGYAWDPKKMSQLAQRTENEWMGVQSGIMDQLISALGEKDHALLIDCRSLETKPATVPDGTIVIIMDTGTRRGLAVDGAYNERREQCEAAAEFFGVPKLRDVTLEQFQAREAELDPLVAKRARHVITENERTLEAYAAMQNGDAQTMGKLMDASHISMRDDFEISTDALNTMVEIAQAQAGCYGARMTGGGFGGCAVALVDEAQAEAFVEAVEATYRDQTEHEPQLYVSPATEGAGIVSNEG